MLTVITHHWIYKINDTYNGVQGVDQSSTVLRLNITQIQNLLQSEVDLRRVRLADPRYEVSTDAGEIPQRSDR